MSLHLQSTIVDQSKGIVKTGAIDQLLSQYHPSTYEVAQRDMAISMLFSALSDYMDSLKNIVRLCGLKRILPRFQGLPISTLE